MLQVHSCKIKVESLFCSSIKEEARKLTIFDLAMAHPLQGLFRIKGNLFST
ncbi:hypothetical protein HMPREF0971_02943 [Segatella oris F0302]|uniref:Uncharacterized protein n=1 Tax=Segatella oris F0302 TaxID=649760 RepID=D1QVG5_9BACT|nr:hypothetical protein HMPREF0971_02943 [Segatella oris F0302]